MKAVSESEICLSYPEATGKCRITVDFSLNPDSPLASKYNNHVYPGTNVSIPLLTLYGSDFLTSFERIKSMLPNEIAYNESIESKQD